MKLNVFLVIVSIAVLAVFVGVGLIEHMMEAEAIAEHLSAQIGVDEDILRSHLVSILRSGRVRRTVIYCSPLALWSILLIVRLIADVGKKKG